MKNSRRVAAPCTLLIAAASGSAQPCQPEWGALHTGTNAAVRSLAVYNNRLYVGGSFTSAGGVDGTGRIARWDGQTWMPVGSGVANNSVGAMAVFDDGSGPALYAGGTFTSAGGVPQTLRIARWDDHGWSALGTGASNSVNALAVFDSGTGPALYAAGEFNTAGGVLVNNIARWDGHGWSALGTGSNNVISALAVFDDGSGPALYAGGSFISIGGVSANRVARWNGQTWSALGSGASNIVLCLAPFNGALYAGGVFVSAGGVSGTGRLARWDGHAWSAVGSGVNDHVHALAVFDDGGGPALYVGGGFTTAGGLTVNNIARWDGQAWSALGAGTSGGGVTELAVYHDGVRSSLYAGGDLDSAGGVPGTSHIARWSCGDTPVCYPNCDNSTTAPVLNVADFLCFLQRFVLEDPYTNCDGSTMPPVLNVADFNCFLGKFGAGCP